MVVFHCRYCDEYVHVPVGQITKSEKIVCSKCGLEFPSVALTELSEACQKLEHAVETLFKNSIGWGVYLVEGKK